MFTSLVDFRDTWKYESEATIKVLHALTDASLGQAVGPQDRSLGRIAWHLATTIAEMMGRTGLEISGPEPDSPVPRTAAAIAAEYERAARSLPEALAAWSDSSLSLEDEMYGQRWKRGATLFILITHQAHHRGQMTVLMRQAGLAVPGVYGPAREGWASMGMAPPEL